MTMNQIRDHLRVCGADARSRVYRLPSLGSSPRVRSRREDRGGAPLEGGIISACAEQTHIVWRLFYCPRDHLRVCGADETKGQLVETKTGSSPRVRSRRSRSLRGHVPLGIISACAEQTSSSSQSSLRPRDHLRVCGADQAELGERCRHEGSSPRVRSRPNLRRPSCLGAGIISACAEQTRV